MDRTMNLVPAMKMEKIAETSIKIIRTVECLSQRRLEMAFVMVQFTSLPNAKMTVVTAMIAL